MASARGKSPVSSARQDEVNDEFAERGDGNLCGCGMIPLPTT
jgi:hypothetical protein